MPSAVDGFFNGIGYSLILIIISVLRELLGMGTILGFEIPYFATTWDKWIIMVMPPGAFFTLACVIWIFRSFRPKEQTK
jgi:Na+-transporting NADH:ubiquinone oxidoreductase subunit D